MAYSVCMSIFMTIGQSELELYKKLQVKEPQNVFLSTPEKVLKKSFFIQGVGD